MKKYLIILALAASCAPTPPESEPNALIHRPVSKVLTAAEPVRTTTVSLVCGCPFVLKIDGAGDTSIIKYSIPTSAESRSFHTATVDADPTGLAAGEYTSWLAISTPDGPGKFLRDTLRDTLVIF